MSDSDDAPKKRRTSAYKPEPKKTPEKVKKETTTTKSPSKPKETPKKEAVKRKKVESSSEEDEYSSGAVSESSELTTSGESSESEPVSKKETKKRKTKETKESNKKKKTESGTLKINLKKEAKKEPVKKEEKKEPVKKETKAKKESTKKKAKKEDSDTDEKPKKKAKKEEKAKKEPKKKAKKEEDEEEVYEWWEVEDSIDMNRNSQKWKTLVHNGVMFPEPYKAHNVSILYDGKPVKMSPEAEEVATMYAILRESDHYHKETFKANFFKDWKKLLGEKSPIKKLEKCDFTPIWDWHLEQKAKKDSMTKEEKKAAKAEKLKQEEPYMFATIDGRKERVGNFRIEPPGLFKGRGDHPLTGSLKPRIQPEDVFINIGDKKDAPTPPKGHQWKEIMSNNTVTWLAGWKGANDAHKYVFFAASSSLKGKSDYMKYENARKLKDLIGKIRSDYKKDWDSENAFDQQLGVALYFIDRLSLRVGNEKGEDEADTVGCCSLRVEHIELLPDDRVKFDFLGKDSMRYSNEVSVEPKVHRNLKRFVKGKQGEDDLFDELDTTNLNKRLKSYMDKLTAKVFRTYNASTVLDQQLWADTDLSKMTEAEKCEFYNSANREVAILCNHQKTVGKGFTGQLEKMDKKVDNLKELEKGARAALKTLASKGHEKASEKWDEMQEQMEKDFEKDTKQYEEDLEAYEKGKKALKKDLVRPIKPAAFTKKALPKNEAAIKKLIEGYEKKIKDLTVQKRSKDENKSVALGTSKLNYCDPRVSIAWCNRNGVSISKVFSKALQQKFPWAMNCDDDYKF